MMYLSDRLQYNSLSIFVLPRGDPSLYCNKIKKHFCISVDILFNYHKQLGVLVVSLKCSFYIVCQDVLLGRNPTVHCL